MGKLLFVLAIIFLTGCAAVDPTPSLDVPSSAQTVVTPLSALPTSSARQQKLTFIEFFAVTWVECREMEPIVNGLRKQYKSCLILERVNFHADSPWHEKINPLGSPEFALLEASGKILYRWSGYTEKMEFDVILKPLCN